MKYDEFVDDCNKRIQVGSLNEFGKSSWIADNCRHSLAYLTMLALLSIRPVPLPDDGKKDQKTKESGGVVQMLQLQKPRRWNFMKFSEDNFQMKVGEISPTPFPLQNGWARALYKPNFLLILGVWEMPLAPTIL